MSFIIRYLMRKLEGNLGLHYHKIILRQIGLWQSSKGSQSSRFLPKYILTRLAIFVVLILGLIFLPMQIIINYGNLAAILEPFCLLLLMSMVLAKGGYLLFQNERVKQLTYKMDKMIASSRLGSKHELEILKECQYWTNISVIVYVQCLLQITFFALAPLPFLFYTRKLYLKAWFPFDVYATPNFEITLLLICLVFFTVTWNAAVDGFIVSMIIQTIGQFKILQYNLRDVHCMAVETVRERRAGRMGLGVISTSRCLRVREIRREKNYKTFISTDSLYGRNNLRRINITDLDDETKNKLQCMANIDSTSSNSELKTGKVKITMPIIENKSMNVKKTRRINRNGNIQVESKIATLRVGDTDLMEEIICPDKDVAMEMERHLKECMKHHQELCSFVNEFESVFSVILSNQLICNVASVMGVMWLTKIESITATVAGFIMLLIAGEGELFFFCWLSNKVTDESSNVREAVYAADWFDASERFKKSMRIIMSRANKPVVIMIAGYIPLSLETFQSVIRLAYSYYTALSSTI